MIGVLYALDRHGVDPRVPGQPHHQLRASAARRGAGGHRAAADRQAGLAVLRGYPGDAHRRGRLAGPGSRSLSCGGSRTRRGSILTVVTIGIGFLLLILEFYAKKWVGGDLIDTVSLTFPTPFQRFRFHVGPSTLSGDHLFAVVVVAILVVALDGVLPFHRHRHRRARVGRERASARRCSAFPVKRVSTIVWVIAALLSAVGVFLRTPLVGLPLSGFVGPSILLFGLVGRGHRAHGEPADRVRRRHPHRRHRPRRVVRDPSRRAGQRRDVRRGGRRVARAARRSCRGRWTRACRRGRS